MKIAQQKFEVKDYWSPDIYNPWAWNPENNSVFYLLEMTIGITGENKGDIYSVIVATPEGILDLNKAIIKKAELYKILLIYKYDWNQIRNIIDEKLASIHPNEGLQAYDKLANMFYWEYEGMK